MLIQLIVFFAILGAALSSDAAETRYLTELPKDGQTDARALTKEKKPGWQCQTVKQSKESGNAKKVAGSRSYWFKDVSDKQEDAAETLLSDGKKAIRCTLKQYDSERKRMANAESDEESAD